MSSDTKVEERHYDDREGSQAHFADGVDDLFDGCRRTSAFVSSVTQDLYFGVRAERVGGWTDRTTWLLVSRYV
jgi:hypothetical protein